MLSHTDARLAAYLGSRLTSISALRWILTFSGGVVPHDAYKVVPGEKPSAADLQIRERLGF